MSDNVGRMRNMFRGLLRRAPSVRDEERRERLETLARGYQRTPDDPLSGIDEVRWDLLTHAYGAATDVPHCLCILAYGDERQREEIHGELESTILHQYTVYPATTFAVPFLIRMIATPWVPERLWISNYLGVLATCSANQAGPKSPGAPSALEAISAGVPVYRAAAASAELELKGSLGNLLAKCTDTSLAPDWWMNVEVDR